MSDTGKREAADSLLCANKEDAKKYIDAIGGKYIKDWEFLDSGEVRLILESGWKNERF